MGRSGGSALDAERGGWAQSLKHTNHTDVKGARVPKSEPRRRGAEPEATDAIRVPAGIVDAPGSEPRLGSVSLGPRVPSTTLVAVIAAPVNPLDLLIASGGFHSARHESAYVPGSEFVGVVVDSDRYP